MDMVFAYKRLFTRACNTQSSLHLMTFNPVYIPIIIMSSLSFCFHIILLTSLLYMVSINLINMNAWIKNQKIMTYNSQ